MCSCDPHIKSPFCGREGCVWPDMPDPTIQRTIRLPHDVDAVLNYLAVSLHLPMSDLFQYLITDSLERLAHNIGPNPRTADYIRWNTAIKQRNELVPLRIPALVPVQTESAGDPICTSCPHQRMSHRPDGSCCGAHCSCTGFTYT